MSEKGPGEYACRGFVYGRNGETISERSWDLANGIKQVRKMARTQDWAALEKWAIRMERRMAQVEERARILLDPGY